MAAPWDQVGMVGQRMLADRMWGDRMLAYAPAAPGGDDEAQNEAESRTRTLQIIGLYR